MLSKGIMARKYHYTKKKSEDCIIRISSDLKKLKWIYLNKLSVIKRQREVPIDQLKGVVYGSFSSTFMQY